MPGGAPRSTLFASWTSVGFGGLQRSALEFRPRARRPPLSGETSSQRASAPSGGLGPGQLDPEGGAGARLAGRPPPRRPGHRRWSARCAGPGPARRSAGSRRPAGRAGRCARWVSWRDADAVIAHQQAASPASALHLDLDRLARPELDGVGQQVRDDLVEAQAIPVARPPPPRPAATRVEPDRCSSTPCRDDHLPHHLRADRSARGRAAEPPVWMRARSSSFSTKSASRRWLRSMMSSDWGTASAGQRARPQALHRQPHRGDGPPDLVGRDREELVAQADGLLGLLEQPLLLAHVPEGQDPPDDLVAQPLRPGEALDDPPVLEAQGEEILPLGMVLVLPGALARTVSGRRADRGRTSISVWLRSRRASSAGIFHSSRKRWL